MSSTSPALRIQDGNQNANYVLMSDANGYGTWKALSNAIPAVFSATGYSGLIASPAAGTVNNTGTTLTLPPGKWLVLTNIVMSATPDPTGGKGAWVRMMWSSSPTSQVMAPGEVTGQLNSGIFVSPYGNAIGTSIINNTDTAAKTYYFMIGNIDIIGGYVGNWNKVGSSTWPENSIIAYPAN